jgi:hypothetical protein
MNRMTFIEVGSGAYGATFLTASALYLGVS